jgi:hypothetical protein
MSRRPWRFAPTEIQRAIKLVREAGLPISKVEIGPDGTITIGTTKDDDASLRSETSEDLRKLI